MSDFFIPDGRNVTNHTDVDRNQFCAAVSAENGGGSPSVCKVVRNDRGHILSGLRDALRHDTVIGAESHEGFSIQFHICRTNTARDFCDDILETAQAFQRLRDRVPPAAGCLYGIRICRTNLCNGFFK